MSNPATGDTGPEPDRTVGYTPLHADDVAASSSDPSATQAHDAAAVNGQSPGTSSRSGAFTARPPLTAAGSRPSLAGLFGKSMMTAAGSRIAPESLIGPYEIIDELGKGGMGIVYKARHVNLNRTVALKMILGGANVGTVHLERFRLEAEAVAKLNHANIVQVYDVGEHNDSPYIALELVDGGNLAKKLDGKPHSPKYAAQTVETLCRAVHAAHAAGVVHRDLKPQNVLLTLDGQPKVTDFGLAKDLGGGEGSGQTHAGSILGTPSYMSPEQAAGRIQDIGPATDIYALGCILYEILTGKPPFRGETPIATIRMVLDGEVVSPRTLMHGIPRDLDTICLKALQKPPHRRYATAEAMAEDLRRFLDGEPIAARPIGSVERFTKWVRRRPTLATMIASGIVAGISMIALGIWSYIAVTNQMHQAKAERQKADDALLEGTRRLVRLNVANGTRMLDTQDYLSAPLWFAEALRLEPGGEERDRIHRIRLRAVFDHCPRLSQVWVHETALTDGTFDSTGKHVFSASEDGIGRLWSMADGAPIGPPLEHGSAVRVALLNPDATIAVTCGDDGFARVWRTDTGELQFSLNNNASICKAILSTDGRTLFCGTVAGRMRVWELSSGKERFQVGFNDRITALAIDSSGLRVAVSSRDGTAQVFQCADGQPITPLLKHDRAIKDLAFFPDGLRLVTASADATAIIWDVLKGQPIGLPLKHTEAVNAVAVTPDQKAIVTACADSTAKVWDTTTLQPLGRLETHVGPVTLVAVSPDGRWFATGSNDNTIRVWDILTGEPISPPLRHNATPLRIQFNANGYELLAVVQTRAVRVWNLITNGELTGTTLPPANQPTTLATPQGRDDVKTILSADGKLSVTYGGGQTVRIRNAADHEPITPPLRTGGAINAIAFSPDSSTLATGDQDGNVMVWSTIDGRAIWQLPGRHVSRVVKVLFNPAGTALASTSEDNTARIWDPHTGASLVPPVRLGATVSAAEFSADGKLLYTELPGSKGRVWDAATGEPVTPPFHARSDWASTLIVAQWSVDEMLAAGRMLSGQRLTKAGDIIPGDAPSLRDDWKMLSDKYTVVGHTDRTQSAEWLRRQTRDCEAEQKWYAVGWNLDQLIDRDPENPDFRRRRAVASAKLGDWKRAVEDSGRAIRLQPESPENWYQRGIALGQLGEWDRAASHLNKAMQLRADPDSGQVLLPKVHLDAGDLPAYRKACKDYLEMYRATDDSRIARQTAWACSLSPESGCDQILVLKLADVGLRSNPADPFAVTVNALALVRAGRVEDALIKLKDLCAAKDDRPTSWAVYAIALARVGRSAESATWRAKCVDWLSAQLKPGVVPPSWDLRAEVEQLLRETKPTE